MAGRFKKRTRLLPGTAEPNGWYQLLPPPPAKREVQGDVRADWAIIGAGACGLAAARRLAELRPDDAIALIDAVRVGYGASGRNAGFMLNHNTHGEKKDLSIDRRNAVLCSAGVNYLRTLVRDHQIQCQWSDWGRIYVGAADHGIGHLTDLADNYNRLKVAYDVVEKDRLQAMLGTAYYGRGLYVGGSALVQPAALMRGLAATLPENVTLFEDSPIQTISRERGFTLACPQGAVTAKTLVLATSVFTEELGIGRMRLVPIATFGSLTRPLTEAERRHLGSAEEFGLLPAHPNGSTVRLTRDHRLLIRNALSYARSKAITKDLADGFRDRHREALRRRWPQLAGVPFDATWGGMLGFTRNDGTLFGRIEEGLYAVVSSDAAPVTRGTAAGMAIADLLCGIESEVLNEMQAMPRAALLPPDPILNFVVNRQLRGIEREGVAEL